MVKEGFIASFLSIQDDREFHHGVLSHQHDQISMELSLYALEL